MKYEKDLVVLGPDKNMEFLFDGVFSKSVVLGLRPTSRQVDTHALRDAGCVDADQLLESQVNRYARAIVVTNREQLGPKNLSRQDLENQIETKLQRSGWGDRGRAVVVDPGIQRWLLEHSFPDRWSPGTKAQHALEIALRR